MSVLPTLLGLKPPPAAPPPDERAVIHRLRSATVGVCVAEGQGSGFLIDGRGFLVTNQHVVGHWPVAVVVLEDRTKVLARVLRSSRRLDLALLLLTTDLPCLPTLPLSTREPEYGERVLAFGNPLSLHGTLTQGIVSHPGRDMKGVTFVQTDASVNHGNSGGPLVTSDGAVVGVNSWGMRDASNLNFALSTRYLWDWMPILEVHLPRLRQACYCNVCGFTNLEPGPHCLRCGARTKELKMRPELEALHLSPPEADEAATAVRVPVDCPVCRHSCLSDTRFCRRCGAALGDAR